MNITKKQRRQRRAMKTRAQIRELKLVRLTVHRTPCHIYAQLFDGSGEKVLAAASTVQKQVAQGLHGTGNIEAAGVEVEINGRPTDWLEVTGSYALQQAQNDAGGLVNSPSNLAKLRFAVPLGRKFAFSGGLQYGSSRSTLQENTLKPTYLADFTLTSKRLLRNFDFRVGLRNAFNLKYSDPIALSPIVDSMPQPGRSYFVELIAHGARN